MRILNVLVFASLMVSLPSAAQPLTEVVAWRDVPDRRWPGPNVWANRLEDWSVQDGVLRCNAGLNGQNWRTAHLLSHDLAAEGDAFRIEVDLDRSHKGQAGILFAAGEGMEDHRRASMVQSLPGLGGGFLIVWQFDRNRLAFLDYGSESDDVNPPALQGERSVRMLEGAVPGRATLVLTARSAGADTFTLKAQLMEGERVIAESMAKVPTARLAGNIALASRGSEDAAGHRFHAIRAGGERIATHHDRGFGPIAGVLYSVANGDLKVGVQCVSLGRTVNASGNNPPSRLSLRLERRSMDGTWTAVTPPTGVSEPDYYTLLRVRGHDTSNAHDFR
ncbi:MAG: twin-arginine translocation pathway signal, partial [Planctomycetota bacterium]